MNIHCLHMSQNFLVMKKILNRKKGGHGLCSREQWNKGDQHQV